MIQIDKTQRTFSKPGPIASLKNTRKCRYAMVTKQIIVPGKIVEFSMAGTCAVEEVLNTIKSDYPGISQGILWNLTAGSNTTLSPTDMRRIAQIVKQHAIHKKTAYLCSGDLEFGLFRMYESYAEIEKAPTHRKVFKNREDAIEWLKA